MGPRNRKRMKIMPKGTPYPHAHAKAGARLVGPKQDHTYIVPNEPMLYAKIKPPVEQDNGVDYPLKRLRNGLT